MFAIKILCDRRLVSLLLSFIRRKKATTWTLLKRLPNVDASVNKSVRCYNNSMQFFFLSLSLSFIKIQPIRDSIFFFLEIFFLGIVNV